ncbi:hypothetical protein [Actinoallomurus soli]|uniref:hypothetical protein n=1 Tax=Actinoallomurus soli TaxID=2952535 RepID=UPI00209265E4|nr:hypothetical protein [Actinoallomurus soli]MCO5968219.1 hypothetical protein [Actinoallomurus soli]
MFSISQFGWSLIAAAATVLFAVGLRSLLVGMELVGGRGSASGRQRRQARRVVSMTTPVFMGGVMATNLLDAGPTAPVLFLYSVVCVSIPIALLPVRKRMIKAYVAWTENPDAEIKTDRFTIVWIVGFLSVVLLVAVIALMMTPYGMRSRG